VGLLNVESNIVLGDGFTGLGSVSMGGGEGAFGTTLTAGESLQRELGLGLGLGLGLELRLELGRLELRLGRKGKPREDTTTFFGTFLFWALCDFFFHLFFHFFFHFLFCF